MDWQAILLSLRLAGMTTGILLVLGTPMAYWLAFSGWRGKPMVEAVVAMPLVLPPTVLGFYVLLALGPHSPLGRFLIQTWGLRLPFTFSGLLLASVVYSLPFTVQPLASAFGAVPERLREASATLGAGRLKTFLRIILPLAWPGVLTGMVLTFAHTLGEFGVVLMVGGNIPGSTRTVSISIYDQVQAMQYADAGRTALLLVVVSFLALVLVYGLRGRRGGVWTLT